MEKFFENILSNIKKIENLIICLFLLLLILFLAALFVSEFNTLKILIFVGLLLILINSGLFLYLQRRPQKEKISLFFLFQNILDYLNEAIVIYDPDFKIRFVNQALSKLVNLKKEDLINLTVGQWMTKNEKYEMLANVFFPFLQGEDLKIINKDPETMEVKFSKPKEKYLLISYFDIFLDKPYKLRVVLDKTEDILEAEKKLEFVQLVSHSLLTPLNEIRWALEALDKSKLSKEDDYLINSAMSIIGNALILAESVLTFLRAESGRLELKIEEIDLEKVFLYILDMLKEKIEEKKLKVNIEISEKAQKLLGDKGLILASLFSLIENAVLYNKNGGSIFIETKKQEGRPYIQITIKDTGVGMSEEDLRNLFKKYYRGKKAKDLEVTGFGFGLYLAKKIIDLHGGEIKIESEENKGTTVNILLPIDLSLIPSLQGQK